jgi:HEAT repeat
MIYSFFRYPMSNQPESSAPSAVSSTEPEAKAKRSMSRTQKILFFATGWLIVLMPFLFWWNTWFGRHLSEQQMTEYLHDDKKPRHIQHALVQMGERMGAPDRTHSEKSASNTDVQRWYPDLVRLANDPVEEVRNTDAWVMGLDPSGAGFHEALLKMLADPSPMVRGNAALSLVRFGDATGRPQIVALLQPAQISAPTDGHVVDSDRPGTAVRQGGLLAKLATTTPSMPVEIRSPIPGRIRSVSQPGANVAAGAEVAVVDPGTEQVWEALRALYLVGQLEDLSAIRPYERDLPDISNDVRKQALETEQEIRKRAGAN